MEIKTTKIGASAAIFHKKKILLIKRAKGSFSGVWSFPGGHKEHGESPEQTALREVYEETGITPQIYGKLDTIQLITDQHTIYELHIFWGTTQQSRLSASDDALMAEWINIEDITNMQTTPDLNKIAQHASEIYHKHLPKTKN